MQPPCSLPVNRLETTPPEGTTHFTSSEHRTSRITMLGSWEENSAARLGKASVTLLYPSQPSDRVLGRDPPSRRSNDPSLTNSGKDAPAVAIMDAQEVHPSRCEKTMAVGR